jgi:Ser/Thr protein kinase RdoA (MazF antagonist)
VTAGDTIPPPPRLTPGRELGRLFGIDAELRDMEPLGRGHIHQTFVASYRGPDGRATGYVHQRLNTSVFPDVDLLMDNVVRVTAHLAARGRRPTLTVRPAPSGAGYALDATGAPWRTFDFIDGARTHHRFDVPATAREAAMVAARLVGDLADLVPAPPEVIPGFHDVVARLGHLEDAQREDTAGRAGECRAEVDAVLSHGAVATEVARARDHGRLPERTVHNDAKADNILFSAATGEGLCLVDLDTVGPGTVLFDVGDLVRSGAIRGTEDGGADSVSVDRAVVDAILDGYTEAGAGFLTPGEVDMLPRAGPLMALEAAARFLTDHLRGDVYFRVDGPGHNLRRARTQLRLLELLLDR